MTTLTWPLLTDRHPLTRMAADAPLLTRLGLFVLLAMAPLAIAMALDDRSFQGTDNWLKPLKFHAALVIYTLTLAVFARWLPPGLRDRPAYRWYEFYVAFAILAELVWIGGAAALGTASHFNAATPVGAVLYPLMGLFAVSLTTLSLVHGWLIWRNPATGLPPALHLAVALGLVLTFVLTVPVAGVLSQQAGHLVGAATTDRLPLLGWARDAGDLRVPHFFATHAMHVLPLAGLAAMALPERSRIAAVWLAGGGYVALVAGTLMQALAGRPFLPVLG
jgi:hypothetical protein